MSNINADVLRVQLTNESTANATLRSQMIAFALDTLRLVWKKSAGVIYYFWNSVQMADQSGTYGSNIIGTPGLPWVTPNAGTPGASATLRSMLTGLNVMSRVVWFDATAAGCVGDNAPHTLVSWTIPAGLLDTVGHSIRVRARGGLASQGTSKTIQVYYAGASSNGIITINGFSWEMDLDLFVVDPGGSQMSNARFVAAKSGGTLPEIAPTTDDPGVDLSVDCEIAIKGTCANTDDITFTGWSIEYRPYKAIA